MASNYSASGSAGDNLVFDRPVGHFLISVASGVTFSFSIDEGQTYLTLPTGFHSFPIGLVEEIHIISSGAWALIGIQA